MPKRSYLLLICLSVLSGSVWAWGRQGHAAVARLAEANLTPVAHAKMHELLENDLDRYGKPSGRTTLAEVSSWADEIRDIAQDNTYKGWHTRSNPVCSDTLGPCRNAHCVDQNIIHFAAVLEDRSQSPRARNEALKWVVHLVGDLHQPLHSGVNKDGKEGGEFDVTLEGMDTPPQTSFHHAWDDELAILALKSGPINATQVDTKPLPADAPTQWMRETREVSYKYAYLPLPGFVCGVKPRTTVVLDRAYQQQAIPVIRTQITRAGLRLAQLLNQLLQ
jgi:hypothetical protein